MVAAAAAAVVVDRRKENLQKGGWFAFVAGAVQKGLQQIAEFGQIQIDHPTLAEVVVDFAQRVLQLFVGVAVEFVRKDQIVGVAVVFAQTSHQRAEVDQKDPQSFAEVEVAQTHRSIVVVGFVVGSDRNQRTDLIAAVLIVVGVVQRGMLYPY